MSLTDILFSGLGSAIISAGLTYYVFIKSRKPPSGKAYEILKKIGKRLKDPEGEYLIGTSAKQNREIAKIIYGEADGSVIGTAFLEDPANYKQSDLSKNLMNRAEKFVRLTCEDVCSSESYKKCKENMEQLLPKSKLIVIPHGVIFSRIDGTFCRLSDNSYLALVSFHDPKETKDNQAVVFRDGIAENYFNYYNELCKRFEDS